MIFIFYYLVLSFSNALRIWLEVPNMNGRRVDGTIIKQSDIVNQNESYIYDDVKFALSNAILSPFAYDGRCEKKTKKQENQMFFTVQVACAV